MWVSAEHTESSIRYGDVTVLAPAPSTAYLINVSNERKSKRFGAFSYHFIKFSVFLWPSTKEHEINIDKPLLFLLYAKQDREIVPAFVSSQSLLKGQVRKVSLGKNSCSYMRR